MSKGKTVIIAFSALYLTRPYFSVLITTPNNWREGLMGQTPTPGTPFRKKETTIKREEREIEEAGLRPPIPPEASEKAP